MCGIVGYIGDKDCFPILIKGLQRLEYRGYDSAGVAVFDGTDAIQVKKQIDECAVCGGKLIFTHLSDYKNLYVQETARCPECGGGNKKLIHILN